MRFDEGPLLSAALSAHTIRILSDGWILDDDRPRNPSYVGIFVVTRVVKEVVQVVTRFCDPKSQLIQPFLSFSL